MVEKSFMWLQNINKFNEKHIFGRKPSKKPEKALCG
jgi:hypothetical protein